MKQRRREHAGVPNATRGVWGGLTLSVTVAALAFAWWKGALLSPFDLRSPGHAVLLALRGLLLASVVIAARGHRRATWIALAMGALFFATLVLPGATLALCAVSLLLLWQLPAPRIQSPRITLAGLLSGVSALALCLIGLHALRPPAWTHPEFPSAQASAAKSARAWLAADNLHRARWAALAWARQEGADPGEAYLFLAEVDLQLGHRDKARRVLEKVRDRSSSEELRLRAAQQLGGLE